MLPKIQPDFEVGTKMLRLCSHAMHPYMMAYVLDHSRTEEELFK